VGTLDELEDEYVPLVLDAPQQTRRQRGDVGVDEGFHVLSPAAGVVGLQALGEDLAGLGGEDGGDGGVQALRYRQGFEDGAGVFLDGLPGDVGQVFPANARDSHAGALLSSRQVAGRRVMLG
jgi:hypothetical protein